MIPDAEEPDMGPCLTAPPTDVGPCLQPIPPDTIDDAVEEMDVRACLSDTFEPDIGPCLDPAPPDAQSAVEPDVNTKNSSHIAAAASRDAIQERLIAEGVLPDDVAAQLTDKKEKI